MGVTAEIRDKYGQAMWTEPWRDTNDVDDIQVMEEGDCQICFYNRQEKRFQH